MSTLLRASIHEQRGLSVTPQRGTSFPTQADRDFVNSVHEKALSAVISVSDISSYMSTDDAMRTTGNMERALRHRIGTYCGVFGHSWDNGVRFLNALDVALTTGAFVFTDAHDIKTFLLLVENPLLSAQTEYYAHTGEIQALLEAIMSFDKILSANVHTSPYFDSRSDAWVRMYRLYRYDVSQVKQAIDAGEDPSDHMSLPLEVRMSFAGCWSPVNQADWDKFPLDHQHLFDDTVFDHRGSAEGVSA